MRSTRFLLRFKIFDQGPTWSTASLLETTPSRKLKGCSIKELAWQAHLRVGRHSEAELERIVAFTSHVRDFAHSLDREKDNVSSSSLVRPDATRRDMVTEAADVLSHASETVDGTYFVVPRVVSEK